MATPPYGLDQPADIKSAGVLHPVSELRKGALRFLDLETTGPVEFMPGVICEAAGGQTEGSMNIIVKTAEGDANIYGDGTTKRQR